MPVGTAVQSLIDTLYYTFRAVFTVPLLPCKANCNQNLRLIRVDRGVALFTVSNFRACQTGESVLKIRLVLRSRAN